MRATSVTLRSVWSMVTGGFIAGIFAIGSATALAGGLTVTKDGALDGAGRPTFTIEITNPAPTSPDGAIIVTVEDPLPGIGTIVWQLTTDTDGSCDILPGDDSTFPPGKYPANQQVVHCDGPTLFEGDSWTIVVTGADPVTGCLSIANTVFVTTDNYPPMTATGSLDAGNCGRMTGGGSIFANDAKKSRVTHGFELHCDASDPRQNLEINWAGGGKSQSNFHLTSLTSANCYDDPSIASPPPNAGFDTFVGAGDGTCNGQPASISFTFTDAGEPGSKDMATYDIVGTAAGCTLSAGPTALTKGNQQAHK